MPAPGLAFEVGQAQVEDRKLDVGEFLNLHALVCAAAEAGMSPQDYIRHMQQEPGTLT